MLRPETMPPILRLSTLAVLLASAIWSAPTHAQQTTFYFRQDWCPDEVEVDSILDEFVMERNGCCIKLIRPRFHKSIAYATLLARWVDKLAPEETGGACTGTPETWTTEDRIRVRDMTAARDRIAADRKREEEAVAAAAQAASQQARKERIGALLGSMLAASKEELCVAFGDVVRLKDPPALAAARRLLAQHKLRVDEKLAELERIKLGSSECQLLASYGLPQRSNRSVGSWGVHVQHIYGDQYVYVRNGIVTSWQD